MPAFLTAQAAAARIGVNERTIRRAIARGELAAAKRAGVYQIAPADLDQYRPGRFPLDGDGGAAARTSTPTIASPPRVRLLSVTSRPQLLLNELPRPLTSFIGRQREAAEVRELLCRDDVRVVTLTGPGGIGKTRLALQAATEARDDFSGGVAFVSLFAVSDPAFVLSAIAHALGVRRLGGGKLMAQLKLVLRGRRLLLLLDNFEHLLPAVPVLADLLGAGAGLKLLVTSQARLHLSCEFEYPVPPLAVPDPSQRPAPAELAAAEAVRLFVARARAATPEFVLADDLLPAVGAICHRLDGIPLAIELAAARCTLLPPSTILAWLERRLPLLTSGAQDQPERLRSMRAAIAWSYNLLSAAEQVLFRRLTVFVRGCTIEAAAAVAGDTDLDVFAGLASLVEKSLLRAAAGTAADTGGEPRFGMLETIREFGLEQLAAGGELELIRRRHAECFLALVEGWAPRLKGAETIQGLDCLAGELPNLRAAVNWALESGETALALRLVAAVYPAFWFSRGDPNEARRWLETGLRQTAEVPARIRVDALDAAAMLTAVQGDYARAVALSEESRALAQAAGYGFGVARAEFCFGMIAEWQGDFGQALVHYSAARKQFEALGDPYWIAMALTNLAAVHHRQGNPHQAAALADDGLARWRDVGNPWGIAMALTAAAAADRTERAAARHREALGLWRDLDDKRGIAGALAGIAGDAAHHGEPERAARLLGAAAALVAAIGVAHALHPAQHERDSELTRAALGEAAFTAAWEAGHRLSLADAIALAIAPDAVPGAELDTGSPSPFGLTGREAEVVRLLARRATNNEIAAALFISPRTVARHVDSILRKLGLDSRREVASLAAAHGLG